jgi:hypothetical protein
MRLARLPICYAVVTCKMIHLALQIVAFFIIAGAVVVGLVVGLMVVLTFLRLFIPSRTDAYTSVPNVPKRLPSEAITGEWLETVPSEPITGEWIDSDWHHPKGWTGAAPSDKFNRVKDMLRNFVLYNDVPQRQYRQIAALEEDGAFIFRRWEGTVLRAEPFEHENTDTYRRWCSTKEEAIAMAENERKTSLDNGWHDYHPALT